MPSAAPGTEPVVPERRGRGHDLPRASFAPGDPRPLPSLPSSSEKRGGAAHSGPDPLSGDRRMPRENPGLGRRRAPGQRQRQQSDTDQHTLGSHGSFLPFDFNRSEASPSRRPGSSHPTSIIRSGHGGAPSGWSVSGLPQGRAGFRRCARGRRGTPKKMRGNTGGFEVLYNRTRTTTDYLDKE